MEKIVLIFALFGSAFMVFEKIFALCVYVKNKSAKKAEPINPTAEFDGQLLQIKKLLETQQLVIESMKDKQVYFIRRIDVAETELESLKKSTAKPVKKSAAKPVSNVNSAASSIDQFVNKPKVVNSRAQNAAEKTVGNYRAVAKRQAQYNEEDASYQIMDDRFEVVYG